jgi:tetratricopeptide (TPR) repeat protein
MDFSWNFPAVTVLFFAIVSIVNKESSFLKTIDVKIRPIYRKILAIVLCLFISWHIGAQNLYMYGLNLSKEGNYNKSNEIYEMANRIYPVSGIGHSLLSQNHYELYKLENDSEHLEKAIISANRSIKLLPIGGEQHNKIGQLYLESGDFFKAEKHLKLGVEYGAYGLNRSIDLASLYIQKDEDETAEKVLNNALKLQPYALKRANKENENRVIVETLKIRLMLKNIYTERGNKEYAAKQNESIVKLIEEYPFLIMYFN